ncbi:MAG: zinc ribbon domain-containing protein [Chloroflexota bacterium]
MPIYDYSCTACRHLVEVIHGINEAGPRFCPNCGEEGTMRKGFSTPAVHFKGSGWAKKDRSTTSSPSRSSGAKSSSGGEGTGGGGGDNASGGGSTNAGDNAGSTKADADSSSSKPTVAPAATASDGGS